MSGQLPKLYPAWRQLERDLLDAGLPDGSTIAMDYLRQRLGLRDPHELHGDDVLREQAQFNFAMGALMASLLEGHRIKLRLVEGVGYMVVPPEDQTRLTLKDRGSEVASALSKAFREVTHVRTEALTEDQRRENADAIAKIGALRAMAAKQIPYGGAEDGRPAK
jgi:hypothetical protein